MNTGNAALLEGFFERQIEIRCINADEYVRRIGEQAAFELAADPGNFTVVLQRFDVAKYGELSSGYQASKPLPVIFGPPIP